MRAQAGGFCLQAQLCRTAQGPAHSPPRGRRAPCPRCRAGRVDARAPIAGSLAIDPRPGAPRPKTRTQRQTSPRPGGRHPRAPPPAWPGARRQVVHRRASRASVGPTQFPAMRSMWPPAAAVGRCGGSRSWQRATGRPPGNAPTAVRPRGRRGSLPGQRPQCAQQRRRREGPQTCARPHRARRRGAPAGTDQQHRAPPRKDDNKGPG